MTKEDLQKFADSGVTHLTLIAMKGSGKVGNTITDAWADDEGNIKYMVGFIKELSGIIVQTGIWDASTLQDEADNSYKVVTLFAKDQFDIILPDVSKITYRMVYMDEKDWKKA